MFYYDFNNQANDDKQDGIDQGAIERTEITLDKKVTRIHDQAAWFSQELFKIVR